MKVSNGNAHDRFFNPKVIGGLWVALLIIGGGYVPGLMASDYHWNLAPPDVGDWFDLLNWSPMGIPDNRDRAAIDNGGTATISSGDALADRLFLGEADGTSGSLEITGGTFRGVISAGGGVGSQGTVTQNGGTVTSSWLYLGEKEQGPHDGGGRVGTYNLIDGVLDFHALHIGYRWNSTGVFHQWAGTLNADRIEVAGQGEGSFTLDGGEVTLRQEIRVGHPDGNGTFTQTAGTFQAQSGRVGMFLPMGTGEYNLSGGTHTITEDLQLYQTGTLNLGGTALLSVGTLMVYDQGVFNQSGGTFDVGGLNVASGAHYEYTGGAINIVDGWNVEGVFDFNNKTVSLQIGPNKSVNLGTGEILNAGNVSLSVVGPDSLVILAPGTNPFGTFSNEGTTHYLGSTLVVEAGKTVALSGNFSDHVQVQGTLTHSGSQALNLTNGVEVSGEGLVDLGEGTLTVEDTISGVSGGGLTTDRISVGATGDADALFSISGGTLDFGRLLSVGTEVGGLHGTVTQNGGTVSGHGVHLAYSSGPDGEGSIGTYNLTGGLLQAWSLDIHHRQNSTGAFNQTGGTLKALTIKIADSGNSQGSGNATFTLSGGEVILEVGGKMYVGTCGNANETFTQTAGTFRGYSVDLGTSTTSTTGVVGYNLSGGTHTLMGEMQIYKSGTLNFSDAAVLTVDELTLDEGRTNQSGGELHVDHLAVGQGAHYEYTGGTIHIAQTWDMDGVFDFTDKTLSIEIGPDKSVNLGNGQILNAGNVSLSVLGAGSLVVLGPGSNTFGSFTNEGTTHYVGAALVVEAGKSLTLSGNFTDHVQVQGVLTTSPGGALNLEDGAEVSGAGMIDLGQGTLTVHDVISGVSGGELSAETIRVTDTTGGAVTISGGTVTFAIMKVGADPGLEATVTQTGGTVASTDYSHVSHYGLSLGFSGEGSHGNGSSGTYNLEGGTLDLHLLRAGLSIGSDATNSTGVFNQSGGNLEARGVNIGHGTMNRVGTFTLSGGSVTVDGGIQLGRYAEQGAGDATFTQTAGTFSARQAKVGGTSDAIPTTTAQYNLAGGTHTITGEMEVNKTGILNLGESVELTADEFTLHEGRANQNGGDLYVNHLTVRDGGHYEYIGGTIDIADSWGVDGVFDFTGRTLSLDIGPGCWVNLYASDIRNAGNVSVTVLGADSLVVPPPGEPPYGFASFINEGITHILGTELVIEDGEEVNISGTFPDPVVIAPGGELSGNGTIADNLTNNGMLDIGNSVGLIEVQGDYVQTDTLHIEVDALDSFDRLIVSGDARLDGLVKIVFNYQPTEPATFQFLTAGTISSATATYTVSGIDASLVNTDFPDGQFAVVPEPSTLVLAAIGFLALLACAFRKRTAAKDST